MFRKAIVVLALIAASALFLGAAPSPASAANCNAYMTATVWQAEGNWLRFVGGEQGCSDVDLVELTQSACVYFGSCGAGVYSYTGWLDVTLGVLYPASNTATPVDIVCGRQYITFTGACATTWYIHPWCGGQTHVVQTFFDYRIHGKASQTWGPWHYARTNNYAIVC